ncbi:alpha/beta hydrolase [Terribacillus saccharophilus]|uniref:alpha/beta hydrolase n=1 Tax=Terribacillus saccharophilus TaxID=361277 RepID=UPI0039820244
MKRLLKFAAITLGLLIFLLSAAAYSFHQYKLHQEKELLQEASLQGDLVTVDGKPMHVYEEGEGENTFVFLSGHGVVAPVYEMKGLYSLFSKHDRIAVIDRAGYGLSEKDNEGSDIDRTVNQTREMLRKSGNKPPYVLVPHSLSGIEAIYWAQKYPEEVKAILALDIGLPRDYVNHPPTQTEKLLFRGMNVAAELGYHRMMPEQVYHPEVIKQGFLTDKEKEIYKAISFKRFLNQNVRDEMINAEANADKSVSLPAPKQTPVLLIAAYTKENEHNKYTDYKMENYQDFVNQLDDGEMIKVEGKHSIYLYAPEEIYEVGSSFIEHLDEDRKE